MARRIVRRRDEIIGLRAVGRALLRNHQRHCATEAIRKGSAEDADAMYDELLKLIDRHSR